MQLSPSESSILDLYNFKLTGSYVEIDCPIPPLRTKKKLSFIGCVLCLHGLKLTGSYVEIDHSIPTLTLISTKSVFAPLMFGELL